MQNRTTILFCTMLAMSGITCFAARAQTPPLTLAMPVVCDLGTDCFVQQMTDLDAGPQTIDPFCGSSSYDGHKGTDFRVLSMADIKRNVPVVASADGVVINLRDGEPDRLVVTEDDRKNVENRECGNGVVLAHGNGIETQYCHMKNGSVPVVRGQEVKKGDRLGYIGASGLAQFPHLHLSVRQNGEIIDPFTGNTPAMGCTNDITKSWWEKNSPVVVAEYDAIILASGLSAKPIGHEELVVTGLPQKPTPQDNAIVAWTWIANLKKGDRIRMALDGPGNFQVENTTEPLNANKAIWSGYAGKKRSPAPGKYEISISILRDGKVLKQISKEQAVN